MNDSRRLVVYGAPSPCHGVPCLIVRGRDERLVTQNCTACGQPYLVRAEDIPVLTCTHCRCDLVRISRPQDPPAYVCPDCGSSWNLAAVVPSCRDRFPYYGSPL
jgi:hypothetical protein